MNCHINPTAYDTLEGRDVNDKRTGVGPFRCLGMMSAYGSRSLDCPILHFQVCPHALEFTEETR